MRMREDRPVRVLIVEDELRMASLIRRGLAGEGLAADVAGRGETGRPAGLAVGDLRLDPATREVSRDSKPIALSAKEFALLETFMRRPGEVLSRLHLLEHAWDFAYENRSNVVDVYVRRLRRKVDEPFGRESLETVRGAGYRLRREDVG